jgi:hypothetical protein
MEIDETTTTPVVLLTKSTTTAIMIKSKNNLKRPAMAPPELELLCSVSTGSSSSDESSLDDSMGSRAAKKCCSSTGCGSSGSGNHKRVTWDQIHTREYTLVVGDHPLCQDGLPVSLGWDHADGSSTTLQKSYHTVMPPRTTTTIRERQQSYAFPRRLSYEERRERLLNVSNLTLDQIKDDEMDLVVRTLRESWDDEGDDNDGVLLSGSHREIAMMIGEQYDEETLLDREGDPLAEMMGLHDGANATTTDIAATDNSTATNAATVMILPGLSLEDGDLGDITNFEWTDGND